MTRERALAALLLVAAAAAAIAANIVLLRVASSPADRFGRLSPSAGIPLISPPGPAPAPNEGEEPGEDRDD